MAGLRSRCLDVPRMGSVGRIARRNCASPSLARKITTGSSCPCKRTVDRGTTPSVMTEFEDWSETSMRLTWPSTAVRGPAVTMIPYILASATKTSGHGLADGMSWVSASNLKKVVSLNPPFDFILSEVAKHEDFNRDKSLLYQVVDAAYSRWKRSQPGQ